MTLIISISSFSNIKSINKSNNISSNNYILSQSSNNIMQCGIGCEQTGIVPHLVGGALITANSLVSSAINSVGGILNGGVYGCN